jgi:hypothetical protein
MSQLEQAKREAKRLFKLAQTSASSNPNEFSAQPYLTLKNLSESREMIAKIHGYFNWHDYEENLKRKDFMQGNMSSLPTSETRKHTSDLKLDYYLQDCPFMVHQYEQTTLDYLKDHAFDTLMDKATYQSHQPVKMAQLRAKTYNTSLFTRKKEKPFIRLHGYPVAMTGSTGAGKTEMLCSLATQYIHHGEGCIYMDGKGDNVLFSKFYSYCQDANRLDDLHCINFMTGSREPVAGVKYSNSFDPVNPMIAIDNENYFIILFGEIGSLIHKLALVCQSYGFLLNSDNIKAMLMPANLISWAKNGVFGQATGDIIDYLNSVHIDVDEIEHDFELNSSQLKHHAQKCEYAQITTELLKQHELMGVFSLEPDFSFKEIMLKRKILIGLFPALEKSFEHMLMLTNIVSSNIQYWAKKLDNYLQHAMQEKPEMINNHFQNIIIDEASYVLNDSMNKLFLDGISKRKGINYIFGSQDFHAYRNNQTMLMLLQSAKTVIIAKCEDPVLPAQLKAMVVDNLDTFHNIFKNTLDLKDQREGQAWIFSLGKNNNLHPDPAYLYEDDGAWLESCTMIYLSAKKTDKIALTRFKQSYQLKASVSLNQILQEIVHEKMTHTGQGE